MTVRPSVAVGPGVLIGVLAAGVAILFGAVLRQPSGGAEPLMAVFPILLVTSLRWGTTAGVVVLIGGAVGLWYAYVGEPFSFAGSAKHAATLLTALVVGGLILGVTSLVRSGDRKLQATNAALNDAMAALALSEAQFRTSFEKAAVGKAHSDPATGRILRVNQALADMLGYQPAELVGRDGLELTIDEDPDLEREAFHRVITGESDAYIREKRYVRRDGRQVWGRVSATVIRSPETGEPVLATAVIENIDERHKADAALRKAKAELEQLLAERTATLAQRDLLLREVYHRVKNNLQIVDSILVLERARITDPDARQSLSALRGRVHALGLVHHQLMGSTDLKTFDVASFLENLTQNLARSGGVDGVRLSVEAAPLRVGLDFAIPLGLVVTELVTNALKHAFPTGPGEVLVALRQAADGSVSLTVADDGSPVADGDDRGRSVGTTIVEALVGQLGGRMSSRRDGGLITEINIAKPVLQ